MRHLRFGRTEAQVPAVSLGTWGYSGEQIAGDSPVGWSGHDDALAREALVKAHQRGITHWDTADVYGDGRSEALIGEVWGQVSRKEIFLATKVGWDDGGFGHFYHPELIRQRMERSLQNLRTESVDLYYLHHCDFGPDDAWLDDAIETMQRLKKEGKTRFIGLSDWDSRKIMRVIERVDPDVVQPFRNIVNDDYEASGLRTWVDEHDCGVAFFSPIKHGLLLGKYNEPVVFPEGDFRRRIPEFQDPQVIARMRAAREVLEERYSDLTQPVLYAVLGALLTDAPTGCVLLGQRNPAQVDAAAAAGEVLSPQDRAWVRSLFIG